jgi:hypothetical protein
LFVVLVVALFAVPSSVGASGRSWTLNGSNGFYVGGTHLVCIIQTKSKGSGLAECSRGNFGSRYYALVFGTGAVAVVDIKGSGPPLYMRNQPHRYSNPPTGERTARRTTFPAIRLWPGDKAFVEGTDIRCDVLGGPTRVVCNLVSGTQHLAHSYSASMSEREIVAGPSTTSGPTNVFRLKLK